MNAIEKGMIFDTTAKRLQELEKKQKQLEFEISAEQNRKIIDLTEKDIKNFYEQALKLEPLMLINMLVDKIILFEDKIEIHFYTPKFRSPDNENQGFFICKKYAKIKENTIAIILFLG